MLRDLAISQLYVAVTRARHSVAFVNPENKQDRDQIRMPL